MAVAGGVGPLGTHRLSAGVDMIITNGQKPEALYSILDNESIGTRFVAKKGA